MDVEYDTKTSLWDIFSQPIHRRATRILYRRVSI